MNPNEYQVECQRTQPSFEQDLRIEKRVAKNQMLIHALMGMCSEGGEFADALKKHIVYNQPLDTSNLLEELGDKMWYIALACTALGFDLEDVMQHNVDKLKLRYPEKFTEEHAAKRLDKIEENFDTTDFPTKPCRQCGKKDRPQYKGTCNDAHCDHFES